MNKKIKEILSLLYSRDRGLEIYDRLSVVMEEYRKRIKRPMVGPARSFAVQGSPSEADDSAAIAWSPGGGLAVDERDLILITYGDQFRLQGELPLATLQKFLKVYLKGVVSGVHILPFCPYSSDDGFSVIDYQRVHPEWGDWPDIRGIGSDFRLMFDLVLNHISARSSWFQGFLKNEERYREFFIVVPEETDVSGVFRPRALPLLSRFRTAAGEKLVWTTFSTDQIDLNYKNHELLLEMIRVLLFYVENGAQFIRLDAIAYLWKEIGTPCIHLEQTHLMVQLFRAVLDALAPWVMIITETNVPHQENISYFGDGYNEAQLVYQFSLPPLVLDAFRSGDASHLTRWASTLGELGGNITFFNFLASHDGIGVLPAHGILSDSELQGLAEHTRSQGGYVSYKSTPQGEIPYELNISYFDAIVHPGDRPEIKVQKFLASQAVMLALAGVPGIYIHSLLGTPNYLEGVRKTGAGRSINRQKLSFKELEGELNQSGSQRGEVFRRFSQLLRTRGAHPAFHPLGAQRVLESGGPVFALLRSSPDKKKKLLCLINTGCGQEEFSAPLSALGARAGGDLLDIVTGRTFASRSVFNHGRIFLTLKAYEFLWLSLD